MISQLEDREAIRELIAEYAFGFDNHDFRTVAELFAEDAFWTAPIGSARGVDNIETLFRSFLPDKNTGFERKHYITNHVIRVTGDTASLRCVLLVVREHGIELIPSLGGTYNVQLVRTERGWRFKHFELSTDIRSDLGLRKHAPLEQRSR